MSLVRDKIVEHFRQAQEQSKFQSGFTGCRRLEDNLFILRYCIEGSYTSGKPLFVMVIDDFAKAFDSVNRVVLLIWHRCDPYLIQVVTGLYMGDCTEIFKGQLRIGQMEVWYTVGMHWITSTVCDDSEYDYKRNTREHSGI